MTAKNKDRQETAIKNSGHLCSVYCPNCGKVTDKISFNLLREAKKVDVTCHICGGLTTFEYDGKKATVWHYDEILERVLEDYIRNKKKKDKANS